jgi:hypothetical protein
VGVILGMRSKGVESPVDSLNVVPLNQVHPSWQGLVGPPTLDAMTHGIELEKARLAGMPFLTLRFDQESLHGGLKESLQVLEGFSDEASAIRHVDQLADQALTASLAAPGPGESTWCHDGADDNARTTPCQEGSRVRCVHLRSFRLTLDTGRDTKSVQFEVLRVGLPEVIGPDLFAYYDAETEWVKYLYSKGKVQAPNLPLSQIHPSWTASMTPSDFDVLTRGIERERARLIGMPFLTIRFNKELDYDGEEESLELLEGFSDEASAIRHVDQLADQTLTAYLEKRGHHNTWNHDVSRDNARYVANHESSLVRCVHLRSFHITIDTLWEQKGLQFEVLSVDLPEGIGPDLLAYYDAEWEWQRHFVSKGKE